MLKKIGITLSLLALILLTSCADGGQDNLNKTTSSDEFVKEETSLSLSREEANEQKAKAILESMTTAEKIGQIFLVRCPAEEPDKQIEIINKYHPGGYILFAADFKNNTPDGVKTNISLYQETSVIPMLIGIDEEGGDIVRISKYTQYRNERFKSQSEMLAGGKENLRADIIEKAKFLTEYGINTNLAPVADISQNPDDYIYDRTFQSDAEGTAGAIKIAVESNNEVNYSSVLKHFPGYANNADTHQGIAYDKRDFETIKNNDLLPFISGIEAGADGIMINHNIIESIDPDMPASLSGKVNELLRNELGFDGVIMTDDLSMKAITNFTNQENPALVAFEAGNDIILQSDFADGYEAIINAYNEGRITEERLNESILRILRWKITRNIIK